MKKHKLGQSLIRYRQLRHILLCLCILALVYFSSKRLPFAIADDGQHAPPLVGRVETIEGGAEPTLPGQL
jgi:hypothetical protein